MSNPYESVPDFFLAPTKTAKERADGGAGCDDLPVGSLRFLRSQEAMDSDLNSRRVLADRERTGESGTLAEVRPANFLFLVDGHVSDSLVSTSYLIEFRSGRWILSNRRSRIARLLP